MANSTVAAKPVESAKWSDVIEQLVREAVAPLEEKREGMMRIPYFREIHLYSADGDTEYGYGFSRDLTPRGIGIMHQASITDEQISIRVNTNTGPVQCRGRLIWSRIIGSGWFFSGCELASDCEVLSSEPAEELSA